jgi:excisionase family DNA binding protein
MDQDAPKTMSVPEAGKQLGLGKNGSYAAVARGEIPVLRFGSRLRVPVVALERMLSEGSSNLRMDTVEVGHAISAARKDAPA